MRSAVELSLKVPVAVSWMVESDSIVGSTGVTDRPVSTGVFSTTSVVPELLPLPPPPQADSRATNGSAIKILIVICTILCLFDFTIAVSEKWLPSHHPALNVRYSA